ncbi:MAG: type I glutamate--ammonia ligase [Thermoplasmata archaeon]|nr:type I glutamate--ammonia ligase [Thermoplasmata archaeon]
MQPKNRVSGEELEAVRERIKAEGIKFVHLVFMDIHGFQKVVIVPSDMLEDSVENGTIFDGSSVAGYATVDESDMRLHPDLSTFQILPWYTEGERTAQVICNIYDSAGRRFPGDPRWVLERWMAETEKMGYVFHTGPEYEYFLFRNDGKGGVHPVHNDSGGYFDLIPMDVGFRVAEEVMSAMRDMGMKVEAGHHEVAPSQYEIDLRYADAMTSADRVFALKHALRAVAKKHGLHATFMPKPIWGVNGSGMHVHQSLIGEGGVNPFYDPDGKDGLSDMAYHFLGGLLAHAREMTAVLASWPNSYKRLVPGYEAPVYISWAHKNRSALVRVPAGRGKATRLELRCADSAGNPYLQFAVMLAAGLDGVRRKIDPPDPIEKNIFRMTPRERRELGVRELPSNMGHALELMKESEFMKAALGEHIFEHFIEAKEREWDQYRTQVTDWEIARYLPVL